ncbi:MAG: FkbM family methyltransferase [Flavobacteriales bacterium]|nr:FkbM family methyltransferase [Flavobacteriales bacterium]
MLKLLFLVRKINRVIGKVWIYFLVHILKLKINQTQNINGIELTINALEKGGQAYFDRGSYQEVINPLYKLIAKECNPDIVIDVGANYGFISVLYAKIFSNSSVVAIEPSKWLCEYIELNKKRNKCNNIEVVQAICDENSGDIKGFSINPVHSQDNRVEAPSSYWKKESVVTTSIDTILSGKKDFHFTFIKIDTQGFEKSVFAGAKTVLKNNSNWLIKTEFSPSHLQKQGTNPKEFLEYLITNYKVVELVGLVNYKTAKIDDLFINNLELSDLDSFFEYLINFNVNKTGWVDLLIKKR